MIGVMKPRVKRPSVRGLKIKAPSAKSVMPKAGSWPVATAKMPRGNKDVRAGTTTKKLSGQMSVEDVLKKHFGKTGL